MNNEKRFIKTITPFYGVIIALSNFLGYRLVTLGNVPLEPSEEMIVWQSFMEEYSTVITCLSISVFVIPALFCFFYLVCPKEKLAKRIINLPLAFSFFGSLGWILSFILETFTLLIVRKMTGISIGKIITTSFLYIFQQGLFIFTFSYLVLITIHSKFVLPKLYPEGRVTKYSGKKNPSIRFLFAVFYISIGFFPVFFLYSTIRIMEKQIKQAAPSIWKEDTLWIMVIFILIFGIILVFAFTSMISIPLKKIKDASKKVAQGDYSTRVRISSNDIFGDVGDSFNDMISSLDKFQDSMFLMMAKMVGKKDGSTGGHIERTSECVKIFSKKLQELEKQPGFEKIIPEYKSLPESFYELLVKAAPMHDIGKNAIEDEVLKKPGKFTDEEYEKMKKHAEEGAALLEEELPENFTKDYKRIAVNVAHYHHEKWDGNGYPSKLSGYNIPVEARIMALADVFDALVSKRCYKEKMTFDVAFNIIEESLGSHFDPELGKVFLICREELISYYENYDNNQTVQVAENQG